MRAWNHKLVTIAAVIAVLTLAAPADAEEGWSKEFAVYLWGLSLDGTQVIRGVPVEVDVGFSDILEDLDMAFTTHFEVKNDDWLILFDVNYAKLGPEPVGPIDDIEIQFAFVELAGGYRLGDRFHLLFGARYITLDVDVELVETPLPVTRIGGDQDWIDPYIGGRVEVPISEKWSFIGRFDVGGFGVGSDFAWNLAALFEVDVAKRTSLIFGVGVLDVEYEDGSGSDLFAYDVLHQGAIMAANFKF